MSNMRSMLLVAGFIKKIKRELTENTIIPDDIIKLCQLFLGTTKKVFIELYRYEEQHSLYLLDLESKRISKLIPHETSSRSKKVIENSYLSYIPNISQYFRITHNNDKSPIDAQISYDGIICMEHPQQYVKILLFESSAIDQDIIKYHVFTSLSSLYTSNDFLFCDRQNGIICEQHSELFKCYSIEIDPQKLDFRFMLTPLTPHMDFWRNQTGLGRTQSITMTYISKNRILAVANAHPSWGFLSPLHALLDNLNLKCGIFDIQQKEWREMADFVLKKSKQNSAVYSARISMCYDEYRDIVYVVGDKGDVQHYNVKKDEWEDWDLDCNLDFGYPFKCWMNNDILYCSDCTYFGFIDVMQRKDKTGWKRMKDIEKLVNELEIIMSENTLQIERQVFM